MLQASLFPVILSRFLAKHYNPPFAYGTAEICHCQQGIFCVLHKCSQQCYIFRLPATLFMLLRHRCYLFTFNLS